MKDLCNMLVNNVNLLYDIQSATLGVFESKFIERIKEVAGRDVYATDKRDPDVISLASRISNMEIVLSEAGQNFPLGSTRAQDGYGASEVTWVTNKLKKEIPDKLLRKAINHLITGSEVTKKREIFVEIIKASVFVVDYVESLIILIGYANAFKCKTIYELGDIFNFHIIEQDYSAPTIRWFYNNTHNVQGRLI